MESYAEYKTFSFRAYLDLYLSKCINIGKRKFYYILDPQFRYVDNEYFESFLPTFLQVFRNLQDEESLAYFSQFQQDTTAKLDSILKDYAINYWYYNLLYGYFSEINLQAFIPGHFNIDNIYYSYGPVDTNGDIVYILGRAPSKAEEAVKQNFCADFGKLLKDILKKYGISAKYNLYFANVVRCCVDSRTKYTRLAKALIPLIMEELAIIKPKYILCLGTDALKVFTRNSLGSVVRDPVKFNLQVDGKLYEIPVFAAPLSALHSFSDLYEFDNAIKIFSDHIEGKAKENNEESIEYDVIKTPQEFEQLVDSWLNKPELVTVAIDLEWQGNYPCDNNAFVRCINLYDGERAYIIYLADPGRVWLFGDKRELVRILNKLVDPNNNIQLVGHNFLIDTTWLRSLGWDCGEEVRILDKYKIDFNANEHLNGVYDTVFMYHAVDECGAFDLEKTAARWVGAKPWSGPLENWKKSYCKAKKITGKELKGYGDVPAEILLPYAAADAKYTYQVFKAIIPVLYNDVYGNNCWGAYWRTMQAVLGFIEMHETGIIIDIDRVNELTNTYTEKLKEIESQLRDIINWPTFNFRSPVQCVELLYGEKYTYKERIRPPDAISFNLKPIKSTSGQEWDEQFKSMKIAPSTDMETCESLMATDSRVKHLRNLRALDQVIKNVLCSAVIENEDGSITYSGGILSFVSSDSKIHPKYSPLKETRRCSSYQPNLQNLANNKEELYQEILGDEYKYPIRSIFVPPVGYKLVEVDYSGAELLMIGVAAQDKNLIDDYYRSCLPDDDPDKLDIHSNIACIAFQLDCPPTKKGLDSLGKLHYRLAAKRIIFGLNYGRGVRSCYFQLKAQGMDITLEDVEKLVDTIYTRYSRVHDLQEEIKRRVIEVRWLANCFKSYRRFCLTRNKEIEAQMQREGLNFICQSAVADAISLATYNFYTFPEREKFNYRLVLNNHDALDFIVPDDKIEEFIKYVVPKCMKEGVKFTSCDLDGNPVSNKQYNFEFEAKIYERWGLS